MGGNEIGDEIQHKAPPNCPKNISRDLLHSSHHANAVINLRNILEKEHQQKSNYYKPDPSFRNWFW